MGGGLPATSCLGRSFPNGGASWEFFTLPTGWKEHTYGWQVFEQSAVNR